METGLQSGKVTPSSSEKNSIQASSKNDNKSESSGYSYKLDGFMDPSDLTNLPEGFHDNPNFQGKAFICEPDELVHLRSIVATFFNYRVHLN